MTSSFWDHIREETRRSPRFAIMVALMIYLLSKLILFPLLGVLISIGFQLDGTALQAILSGEAPVSGRNHLIFWILQGGNQLLSWGLVAWIMIRIIGSAEAAIAWRSPVTNTHLWAALGLMLLALPLAQGLTLQPEQLDLPHWLDGIEARMHAKEAASQRTLLVILNQTSPIVMIMNLLVFALLPAICEEAFFRGFLQRQLQKSWGPLVAIIVTALAFSFIHFQVYGFFSRAMLGGLLGILLWRSGSLFPSILAHFIYNAASVVATYFLALQGQLGPETFSRGYGFTYVGIAIGTGVGLLALWAYFRLPAASDQDQVLLRYEK
ncbi:MAG: CPBP family intramembrane glutamic endopeptidase [Bacteroidota bacterium]